VETRKETGEPAGPPQDQWRFCVDCQRTFCWDVQDQLFFRSLGYIYPPNRCRHCRKLQRAWMRATAEGYDEDGIVDF
jgi:hypothetical protein